MAWAGRRRYVQIDGKLVEVSQDYVSAPEPKSAMIMPDIQPFISPIDRREVTGRAALREHNLVHDVTNASDFKGVWEKAAQERASRMDGSFKAPSIKESLVREYNRRNR